MVFTSNMVPSAQTVRLFDPSVGLDGAIVIHSTALGPAAGGCRFWRYAHETDAIGDAARLAQGMTYKNAMAALPFGGGKAVLRVPSGPFNRTALFHAFAQAVDDLAGSYVTAEDVGTTVADMRLVSEKTCYVAGLEAVGARAGGDPSPWTARGVYEAMKSAARAVLGADLGELRIAIQGVGNVGRALAHLLTQDGASLTIADIDNQRAVRVANELGARVVDVTEVSASEVDVFAPCALGGALSLDTLPRLHAKLVCGGANNQLASDHAAEMLRDLGIAYVPDYVANSGGIISVTAEYLGESQSSVAHRVAQIGPRVAAILAQSARENLSPAVVADRMAQDLVARAGAVAA